MSITKLTDGKYAGLSRDIKPREAKIGASFYEYDTEDLYDKTLNINVNNGWKKRVLTVEGGGSSSDTIKAKITSKSVGGNNYLVIMAGSNFTDFEMGDIVIGRIGAKLVIGEVTIIPVTSSADFGIGIQGEIL